MQQRPKSRQLQQHHQSLQSQRVFTASEVAEFEYCPLAWWYEQFDPMARADTDELFAYLVELEQENGPQAPALPEYQVVEQLLLRRGAFDEGQEQHREHAEEVAEIEEERHVVVRPTGNTRTLVVIALVILVLALLLIGASFVLLRL
jgi:hypothetical protein